MTGGPALPRRANFARALYVAARCQTHSFCSADRWLQDACTRRRWAPGRGEERVLLAHARCYTAAHHVLKFLANGLPGHARRRSAQDRYQRQCNACRRAATSVWLTASATTAVQAWCVACAGGQAAQDAL